MSSVKRSNKTVACTVGMGAMLLITAGCSSNTGGGGGEGAVVDAKTVTLDTDRCPAEATAKLEPGEEIVIGMSTALSGPVSAASNDMVPVIEGYFKMLNEQGGIDGHKLRFIAKDDAYEAARAVGNVKALVENEKVMATMLQLGTAQSTAVQTMHESSCVPQLAVSSGAPNFYNPAEHPYSTSNFFPYAANGSLMVNFLTNEFPAGAKVGGLVWNNDFGASASKAFESAIGDAKVEVVGTVNHDSTAVSLSGQVTQLLSKSPDALVASTGSGFCSQFVNAARSGGFNGPIMLPYACSDASDVLFPLKDKAVNVYAPQSFIDTNSEEFKDTEAAKEYHKFLDKYSPSTEKHSSFAATAYQQSALLTDQLKRAAASPHGLSRVGLMDAVWTTDGTIGLDFPEHGTVINGEFPYPTGYAVMGEFDPATKAWKGTQSSVLANGEKP
ncbi:ABC transporter substrate-binding protein [Gephyromycinifex aptenodytis]|uniref:ABC transporter substrate-binding protein n=1 Tax=Gephyromycinifex aptenodytis TaxID=2716227 RepID=UPI0014458CF6|nr:ABC transporter substrate-binding protein [Gephyromycinifex aptenodytis]